MKLGMRWQSVSTWMMKLKFRPESRNSIRRSKIGSQFLLRAKLSSVMKKLWMPAARFSRMMRSTSSALRWRDLRPCTLMMVQNEHWNGQPRPASKLVTAPVVRLTTSGGQEGRRRVLDARQVVHVIVERLERAVHGVAQHVVEPALRLAGEQADAEVLHFANVRRQSPAAWRGSPRHGSRRWRSGAPPARRRRARSRARGNWFDCTPTRHASPWPGPRDRLRDFFGADARVGLVIGENLDLHVRAERVAARAIGGECRSTRRGCWREWPSDTTG